MTARAVLRQVERRPHEVRLPGLPWPSVRRIVVVRDDRLGDLVLTLPAVDALRRAYPGARLALMVRSELVPLAGIVAGVNDVLAVGGGTSRWRQLAEFRPDLLVCISRTPLPVLAGAAVRVRWIVGSGYRWYSPLLHRTVPERRRRGRRHELEYALSFAHRCGAPAGAAAFALVIPDGALAAARAWLGTHGIDGPFVVLHPGSGGSCPAWPLDRWVELAQQLAAEGRRPVVSIGPGDSAAAAAFDTADADVRELPRIGAGLVELAAVLDRAAVCVANNTGPLHLAAALGTATIGLYSTWRSCGVGRWGPYADNGWGIATELDPGSGWSKRRRHREGDASMRAISTDFVARCTAALLEGKRPPED